MNNQGSQMLPSIPIRNSGWSHGKCQMSIKGDENTGDQSMQLHVAYPHSDPTRDDKGLMSIKGEEHRGDPPTMPPGLRTQEWEVSKGKGLKPIK